MKKTIKRLKTYKLKYVFMFNLVISLLPKKKKKSDK